MPAKRGARTTAKFTFAARSIKKVKAITDWENRSAGRKGIYLGPRKDANEKPKTSG